MSKNTLTITKVDPTHITVRKSWRDSLIKYQSVNGVWVEIDGRFNEYLISCSVILSVGEAIEYIATIFKQSAIENDAQIIME